MNRVNLPDSELHVFKQDLQEPFYAWECVTLLSRRRTYDFVIEQPEILYAFINAIQYIVSTNFPKRRVKNGIVLDF